MDTKTNTRVELDYDPQRELPPGFQVGLGIAMILGALALYVFIDADHMTPKGVVAIIVGPIVGLSMIYTGGKKLYARAVRRRSGTVTSNAASTLAPKR